MWKTDQIVFAKADPEFKNSKFVQSKETLASN